eukprot:gene5179-5254_t
MAKAPYQQSTKYTCHIQVPVPVSLSWPFESTSEDAPLASVPFVVEPVHGTLPSQSLDVALPFIAKSDNAPVLSAGSMPDLTAIQAPSTEPHTLVRMTPTALPTALLAPMKSADSVVVLVDSPTPLPQDSSLTSTPGVTVLLTPTWMDLPLPETTLQPDPSYLNTWIPEPSGNLATLAPASLSLPTPTVFVENPSLLDSTKQLLNDLKDFALEFLLWIVLGKFTSFDRPVKKRAKAGSKKQAQ